ncbi:hypothetical protein HU200_001493 [Digitaria exilis]|uniref:Uncharacterized protein n=1 Tax=Digitaria exilis TaxID=1010633 RepID=A0A835FWV7_9POAL|nr:hypothetical protein HU200_001493 [Digitaria exilis]
MEHILIQCSFSQQIWWAVLQRLGFASITPGLSTIQDWWLQLRVLLPANKQKRFDSLFALIAWQLRKERNARVFHGVESQPSELLQRIKKEGEDWITAGAIWKERNARVFRGVESQPSELLQRIKKEREDWITAGAKKLGCLFSE